MAPKLTREQHVELYYYMQLNRQLEERMTKLFRQNKIVGGLYASLGQEAVSIGTAYALGPQDWLAPMIRNIGSLLVKGFKPRDIFTQHMARYTSPTHTVASVIPLLERFSPNAPGAAKWCARSGRWARQTA